MRTFVIGDIHGAFKALQQCLERSNFNYGEDTLIQLGDITDGYAEVYECVEELLKIRNLKAIKGNHDEWFREFIATDFHPYYWTYGGKGTLISYLNHCGKKGRFFATGSGYKTSLDSGDIPDQHKEFFNNQKLFHIDEKKRCFVHAGFRRELPFLQQKESDYFWHRGLWLGASEYYSDPSLRKEFRIKTRFKEIFIGHTPTVTYKPERLFNIINVDSGAGGEGRLTIMDIDSKEYWQSDLLPDLYDQNFRNAS